jgi:hypothetical protein
VNKDRLIAPVLLQFDADGNLSCICVAERGEFLPNAQKGRLLLRLTHVSTAAEDGTICGHFQTHEMSLSRPAIPPAGQQKKGGGQG